MTWIGLVVVLGGCGSDTAQNNHEYVSSLNAISLLAQDATSGMFPSEPPSSSRRFVLENLSSSAAALRDLAELTPQRSPPRFHGCHDAVRAQTAGLATIADALLPALDSEQTITALEAWGRLRSRTQRRLCGLSAALSACDRLASDRILGFVPTRCLDSSSNPKEPR